MIRFAAPLFLVLALAACPTARKNRPSVEMSVAAVPEAVRAGDTVRVTATVRNPSGDTMRMVMVDADACVVSFYVRREDTKAVVEPADGVQKCEGGPWTLTLAPGQTQRFQHRWVPADSLPPGAYTAYAVLPDHHLFRAGKRELKAGHRANEVSIRLTR